jgi:predicted kinase
MPEMVILVGIQAAGKTSFYRERFFNTHVRISLDLMKTRDRERHLIAACLAVGQPFVIDNTNTLSSERAPYLAAAKQAGFRSIGYFFKTELRAAIARNNKRQPGKIPVPAIIRSHKRLEPPTAAEGFDVLYTVTLDEENRFTVEP